MKREKRRKINKWTKGQKDNKTKRQRENIILQIKF